MFSERIKELRIQNQMPQRQLAAALDIDTATYCKIEKGERKVKKEQISVLSKMFNVNTEHLLILWLADQVSDIVSNDKRIAPKALLLVVENLKQNI
ncbi:MAG: helix-turn-helix transcriptional regulator [Bacteroidales bacterium]